MKKIIKSKIFPLLLGIIVSAGIYVTAATIMANRITYNDGTVKTALDTLYQRTSIPKYNGEYWFDPSPNEDIIIPTSGLLLKNNIGVNKIPNQYKNLSTATTATASDIIKGKTGYNSNGELITGTLEETGECVYKVWTCTTCTSTSGQDILLDFTPTNFILYSNNNQVSGFMYNEAYSKTKIYHSDKQQYDLGKYVVINENSINVRNFYITNVNVEYYLIYCR